MAPSSKGKKCIDHVVSFNLTARQLRFKTTEKTVADLEKLLAVLAAVTDLSSFGQSKEDLLDLLVNCQHILSSFDSKSSCVWSVVSLLTHLAASDKILEIMRERLEMLETVSRLLEEVPATNQARTLKVLQLMRLVAQDVRIYRRSEYLTTLMGRLAASVQEPARDLAEVSVFVLCCLCRANYMAVKLLTEVTSEEDRHRIFTTCSKDPKPKVTSEYLSYLLSKTSLMEGRPNLDVVKGYQAKITAAFVDAYSSEDVPMMRLAVGFLEDLSKDEEYLRILSGQECLISIRELLLASDFTDGFSVQSAELLFRMVLLLSETFQIEPISLFDTTHKAVLTRLEVRPYNNVSQALLLVKKTVKSLCLDDVTDAVARNLKFQVDQLLTPLFTMFTDAKRPKTVKTEEGSHECGRSYITCIQLLQVFASVEAWVGNVCTNFKASKMMSSLTTHLAELENKQDCSTLVVEFMTLAKMLADTDVGWGKLLAELAKSEEMSGHVTACLTGGGGGGNGKQTADKVLQLLPLLQRAGPDTTEEADEVKTEPTEELVTHQTVVRIDKLLDRLSLDADGQDLEENLGSVLQLVSYRRFAEKDQIESLKTALGAADARIAAQTSALVQREVELDRTGLLATRLADQLAAAKRELADLRRQQGSLNRETSVQREHLQRELAATRAELERTETENAKLIEKSSKYKSQVEQLGADLAQYKENEKQLQDKLKHEVKAKEELAVLVQKKDDKLRKKERALEEEMTQKEMKDKENEELRSQCSSLETLSKRLETALNKKEKQLKDSEDELKEVRRIQDQIFNLSKARNLSAGSS